MISIEKLAIYLLAVGGVILWWSVITLLNAKKKECLAKEAAELKRAKILESASRERLTPRIEATTRFVDLIRVLVQDQVYGRLQLLEVLKQPYPVREIDNDVKDMSDKVFTAIATSAYKAPDNILSEDAIMNFIIDQVTIILSASAAEYNGKLYAKAANLE